MTSHDLLIDKRIVQRNIEQGKLEPAEYQRLLNALPDLSDKVWRRPAAAEAAASSSSSTASMPAVSVPVAAPMQSAPVQSAPVQSAPEPEPLDAAPAAQPQPTQSTAVPG